VSVLHKGDYDQSCVIILTDVLDVIIALSVIVAVYTTIYSLTHGIYEVFPFLYFLPIFLFVNYLPQRGVISPDSQHNLSPAGYFSVVLINLVAVSTGVCDLCYHWFCYIFSCRWP